MSYRLICGSEWATRRPEPDPPPRGMEIDYPRTGEFWTASEWKSRHWTLNRHDAEGIPLDFYDLRVIEACGVTFLDDQYGDGARLFAEHENLWFAFELCVRELGEAPGSGVRFTVPDWWR